MYIDLIGFTAPEKNYYTISVKCVRDIENVFYRSFKEIKATNADEAFRVVKELINLAEETIFLEDNRFTGNTCVMAQMVPQTNSSRFFDHILDGNQGSKWVKGYIITETTEHITLLVGDKYEVGCFKENVIIIKD